MKDSQTSSGQGQSPFIVGIDLGTTNCATAFIDTTADNHEHIQIFPILQFVSEGNLSTQPLLPSYLYLPSRHELLQENIRLPWDEQITYVVGELAKQLGSQVPARLVSSAKSWLCHSGVDRRAAILPWGGGGDLDRLSPVDASACYLKHIRDAWNHQMARGKPEYELQKQEIILTVPASFDEVARELTLEAARKVGLARVTLLEEPQAAFYCWIANHRNTWPENLYNGQIILICDVGGGTSDFSLITLQEEGGKPLFTRVAVGDHLILGGDNIDLALARHIELRLKGQSGTLDSGQYAMLAHGCRKAKEELLTEGYEREMWPVILQDRSSRLVGSTLKYELTREEMIEIIENGFFPISSLNEEPARAPRLGLQEWGLPYVHDTAIPRHLSSFLRKHQATLQDIHRSTGQPTPDFILPEAILFNGGALKPPFIQERIIRSMENWFTSSRKGGTWSPYVLSNRMGDLAVAYGAAYYGLVRQGKGIRISGGLGRSYYLGIGTGEGREESSVQALCVVPRKMEEGQEIEIKEKEFILLIGEPVSFPLYTSSTRLLDQAGDLLPVSQEGFDRLPPMQTILRRGRARLAEVPVHIRARVTEIGTLEVWCVSRDGDRQWRLQFGLRDEGRPEPASSVGEADQESVTEDEILDVQRVQPLLSAVFEPGFKDLSPEFGEVTPENLFKNMEKALNVGRQNWPIFTLRKISEMLLELAHQRERSAEHESRWCNLAGFCLRPGFGYSLDEWRIKKIWKIFPPGILFPKDREARLQWWILWRRVAGGLKQNQQVEIFRRVAPYLIPQKKAPAGPKPSPHELAEMWRLAASLEQLTAKEKERLGLVLLDRLSRGKFLPADLWCLARLGARQPFYGSLHTVVPSEVAEQWIEKLLPIKGLPIPEKIFSLAQLARLTSDRARNISEAIRNRVIDFLTQEKEEVLPGPKRDVDLSLLDRARRNIREVSRYQSREQTLVFGESLPKGLQLKSS